MGSERWRRPDPVDLGWRGIRYTRAYLGVDVPPAAAVRAALVTMAPQTPELARVFAADGRWRALKPAELGPWAASSVTANDESSPSPERAFASVPELVGERRFHLVVGPDWVAIRIDHSFGDGRTADLFVSHVLRQAGSADPLPASWQAVRPVRRDLAIAAGVLRHLPSLPWVLQHRAELAGGSYGPLDPALRPVTVVDVSPDGFMDQLRRARTEYFPQASAAALVTAGLRAGIAAELGEPRPGFECLFNTRDERDGGVPRWGNWSVGAYLRPDDDYAPASVARALHDARERGVAAFGLASMRAAGAGRASDHLQAVLPERRPRLTISYVPPHYVAELPGLATARTLVVSETLPNGPDTLTFQTVETGGVLAVSTAHFPSAWPTERVRAGVRAFLDTPLDLLLSHAGRPGCG